MVDSNDYANLKEYIYTKCFDESLIESLFIDSSNSNVKIVASTSKNVNVRLKYRNKQNIEKLPVMFNVSNNELKMTYVKKSNNVNCEVDIEIPKEIVRGNIQSNTGNIVFKNAIVSDLEIKSHTGNISVESVSVKNMAIFNKTGNTGIVDSEFERFKLNNENGNVTLNHCSIKWLSAKNVNGRVKLSKCDMGISCEDVVVCNSNGNVFTNNKHRNGKEQRDNKENIKIVNINGNVILED